MNDSWKKYRFEKIEQNISKLVHSLKLFSNCVFNEGQKDHVCESISVKPNYTEEKWKNMIKYMKKASNNFKQSQSFLA